MRATLKRSQRQKLRKELQNRVRSGEYSCKQNDVDTVYLSKRKQKEQLLFPRAKPILVGFLVAGIALSLGTFLNSEPDVLQVGTTRIFDAFSISQGNDSTDGVDTLDSNVSWQGHFSNDLPEGFDEEIGLGGTSMAVSNDGRTVGYSVEGSIDETMAEIKKHLEEKGWSYVPSGQESVATFAKDTGTFCWLAVTCASVGTETSVVLVYEENPANHATE